jgi:hypothetical protein
MRYLCALRDTAMPDPLHRVFAYLYLSVLFFAPEALLALGPVALFGASPGPLHLRRA